MVSAQVQIKGAVLTALAATQGRSLDVQADAVVAAVAKVGSDQMAALDYCQRLKALDAEYHTDVRSPLHHDNNCTRCNVRVLAGVRGN